MKKFLILALMLLSIGYSSVCYADTSVEEKLDTAIEQQANIEKNTPAEATQGDSFLYGIYVDLADSTIDFSDKISSMLTVLFVPIVILLMCGYIGWLACQHVLKNESLSSFFAKNISYLFYMTLVLCVITNYDYWTDLIYRFFINISIKILELSVNDTTLLSSINSDSGLKNSFIIGDKLCNGINRIMSLYQEQNESTLTWWNNIVIGFKALSLEAVYYGISIAFMVVWTTSSITMLIFFALGKPLILLSLYPPFRFLMKSWGEALLNFGMTMIFVSIAMGLTVFTLSNTFHTYILLANENSNLPESTFTELLLVGGLSLFYHIQSSTMASMLTKAHVQDFGRTFTAMTSLGFGGGKAVMGASTKGVGASVGVVRGSQAIGKGVLKAGGQVKNYFGNLKKG